MAPDAWRGPVWRPRLGPGAVKAALMGIPNLELEDTMRKIRTWLLAIGLQALALAVCAQEAYLGGALGRSSWSLDCGAAGCERSTSAARIAAGYRFNRLVAVEGFYLDFGRARSSDFSLDGKLGATAMGVQTLLGWQFGGFELAGKLGLASMRNQFRPASSSLYSASSVHRNEFIGGLMGAYRVAPHFSVRLDLDLVTVALDGDALYYARGSDVATVMLGVVFRF
jgi:hypothetical protein